MDTLTDQLVVPNVAVQNGQQGTFVYVVDDNSRVHLKPVHVGITTDTSADILSGISEGDRVVIDGTDRLSEGTEVRVRRAGELDEQPSPAGGGGGRRGRRGNGGGSAGSDSTAGAANQQAGSNATGTGPPQTQPEVEVGVGADADTGPRRFGGSDDGSGNRRMEVREGVATAEAVLSDPSKTFILRPVATALMMLGIVVIGVVAFRQLPVSALPQVDYLRPATDVLPWGKPGGGDVFDYGAARETVRAGAGTHADDVDQVRRQFADHTAVFPRSKYRYC